MNRKAPPIRASRDIRRGAATQRAAIAAEKAAGVFDADAHLRNSPVGRVLEKHPEFLEASIPGHRAEADKSVGSADTIAHPPNSSSGNLVKPAI